ncbi:hypothetical protein ABZ840_07980 [Streptomyces sp. NPDC047117]|uniref:hypothetical protein n=1 Tax=Streptomyces sp. NPDC047117 TaxID=3155379 RepID=UPI0033FA7080
MTWPRTAAEETAARGVDVVEPVETGWAAKSTGAMANRTALIRWGAWTLVLGGPLLSGWAVALAGATTMTPVRVQPQRVTREDTVGPARFAEQAVAAYVRAGQGASSKELAALYPSAADLTWSQEGGAQRVESISPVRVRKVSGGYWSLPLPRHRAALHLTRAVLLCGHHLDRRAQRQPGRARPTTGRGERRNLVEVEAGDRQGTVRPMTYAIQLRGRDGRWEVAALEAAPALKTPSSGEKNGASR